MDATLGRCIVPHTGSIEKDKQIATIASKAVAVKKAAHALKKQHTDTVPNMETSREVSAEGNDLPIVVADGGKNSEQRYVKLQQEVNDLETELQRLLTKMKRTSRAMSANIPGLA